MLVDIYLEKDVVLANEFYAVRLLPNYVRGVVLVFHVQFFSGQKTLEEWVENSSSS
jgi:hypothetical protein